MTPLTIPIIEFETVDQRMVRIFEEHMMSFGLFEDNGKAMMKCSETGEYYDPDTNAMWTGFKLGFLSACEHAQGGYIPNNIVGTVGELL